MKRIAGFDKVQERGSFTQLPAGGYVCAIKNVQDFPDNEYLRIEFDIVKNKYKGYFQHQYDTMTFTPKYWSGYFYVSYNENSLSRFKSFTTSIEKSNKGYKWDFDEKTLKNKYFGAVIGWREYLKSTGKVGQKISVQVHSVERIESGDFTVPALKKLEVTQETTQTTSAAMDAFSGSSPFAQQETPAQAAPDPFADNSIPFDVEEPSPFD